MERSHDLVDYSPQSASPPHTGHPPLAWWGAQTEGQRIGGARTAMALSAWWWRRSVVGRGGGSSRCFCLVLGDSRWFWVVALAQAWEKYETASYVSAL